MVFQIVVNLHPGLHMVGFCKLFSKSLCNCWYCRLNNRLMCFWYWTHYTPMAVTSLTSMLHCGTNVGLSHNIEWSHVYEGKHNLNIPWGGAVWWWWWWWLLIQLKTARWPDTLTNAEGRPIQGTVGGCMCWFQQRLQAARCLYFIANFQELITHELPTW